jgi:hypothetical protein
MAMAPSSQFGFGIRYWLGILIKASKRIAKDRLKIRAKETPGELASQFREACNILRIDLISLIIICLYFAIVNTRILC